MRRVVICALLALSEVTISLGQVATGNIRGTVVDSSGAVLPKTSIRIHSDKTGFDRSVLANERGDFNVASVPVGVYQIIAEAPGFQKTVLSNVELQVDQTAIIPIQLAPGSLNQTVEVAAAAPLLESQTSSLGQVIQDKQILDMPLNGRNPFALGILAGGTVPFQGLSTNLPIAGGGGRYMANDILLDGVDDNLRNYAGSVGRAGLAYTPSVDAVEEFKVKTNDFSAEYGHSAGYVMNATIKSGTNEYHGALWEFLRNDKLDANNFVSNYSGQPRAPFHQNQFGAAVGGAVRLPYYKGHNRTFFFVDYEGTQIRQQAGSTLYDEPPAVFRNGDFSGGSTIVYDPATRVPGANGVVSDQPFPGNMIPSSRINPAVAKYQSLIPQPNVGGPNASGPNYLAVSPVQTMHNQGDARIDHKLTAKNNLMVRVSASRADQPNQGAYIYSPTDQLFNTINAVLGDTHLFSPTFINEFRFGFNRTNDSKLAPAVDQATAFAAANGFQSGQIIGFPNVNWTYSGQTLGSTEFSNFTASTTNYAFENNFEWTDDITIIRGAHTIKAGADLRRFRFDRLQGFPPNGNYYFGATYTSNPSAPQAGGLPYADFLLGLPTSVINSSQIDWSMQRDLYFGPFIQDDWKVSSRLTLNLGFRYDLYTQPVQARNVGGMFDPYAVSSLGRLGEIILPGQSGYSRAIVDGHHRNFAPRFGFAYQASQKLVVRGGYGIFFSNREQNDQTTDFALSLLNFRNIDMPAVSAGTTVQPPYTFTSPLHVDALLDPQLSQFSGTNPLSSDSGSFNEADLGFSSFPMLQQFNLAVQYEFIPNLLVEASYQGARGVHWVQRIDLNEEPFQYALAGINTQANRPFPYLASSQGLDTADVSTWYNAFNLRVERRYTKGLVLLANYTISRSTESGNAGISTFGNEGNTRAMNTYNVGLERGLSPLDVPQKLILSADYELPMGKGHALSTSQRWLNGLIGGWHANGILSLRSGFPTSVLTKSLPPVFADMNRPDVVPGQSLLAANPTFDQYFNPAALVVSPTVRNALGAPVQTFGDAGPYLLRGPGARDLDFSLFKDFRITESKRLEFRAEAFNLTNTPTFTLPSATSPELTVGNAAYGKLVGSQTVGRQVQFGLKFLW